MIRRKRKIMKERYDASKPLGDVFTKILQMYRKRMLQTDDNFLMICTGPTGSGKTHLSFQAGEAYTVDDSLDKTNLSMDKETFVNMLMAKINSKGEFIVYDEGSDVNRRSSLSSWNRDFLDAMFTLRGKNWFLWINLPDPNYLDRMLIESELINGLIFIHQKQKRFYFFTRDQVKAMYKEHGNLKPDTIKEFAKDYNPLDSFWNKYEGKLIKEYDKIKQHHMDKRIQRLVEKYGRGESISAKELARRMELSETTIYRHLGDLYKKGYLVEARGMGSQWRLRQADIDVVEAYMTGGFEAVDKLNDLVEE